MATPAPVFPIDHTTPGTAGPGQPLHLDEYGQSFYPDVTNPTGPYLEDPTSLHPGKYLLTLTLYRMMRLLVKSISSMQSVAVQQAERLTFLTEWQKAYTDRMNNSHTFTQSNGDAYVSATDTDSGTTRQSLNQKTSTWTEADRSNNSIVSDTAKALQTNINQTQDAVNQQSNLVTSLLQQLNSIASAIYR